MKSRQFGMHGSETNVINLSSIEGTAKMLNLSWEKYIVKLLNHCELYDLKLL